MDLSCIVAIFALVANINFSTIVAFPQTSSLENNARSSFPQGSRNAKPKTPYGYTFTTEKGNAVTPTTVFVSQPQQENNPNFFQPVGSYEYPAALDTVHDDRVPSMMVRTRRSYGYDHEQQRPFPAPFPNDKMIPLIISKASMNGQIPDHILRYLSMLNVKPPVSAIVDDDTDTDFADDDDTIIDIVKGGKPHTIDIVSHTTRGKDLDWDDTPDTPTIVLHTNNKNGRLRNFQKKEDMVGNAGRLYSLGQLLQNSQKFVSNNPVHRRYIL